MIIDNIKRGLLLLGCIMPMFFTSCGVTLNKYSSPKVDLDNLYRNGISNDTTSIANIVWEDFFADTLLQSLIKEGLANNHDMLIATERIKQAESANKMARAAYFPTVDISGQFEQLRLNNNPSTGRKQDNILSYHNETYSLNIISSWELDIWGKLRSQSKAKYAEMLNCYVGRNLVQTSLISNIAGLYYSLLSLDEQLVITDEIITSMRNNLRTMEYMRESGLVNSAAVEQTKAALYRTITTLPDLKSMILQLENSICLLIGRKPDIIERTTLELQSVPQQLYIGIPIQMIAKRPDVQKAELDFRMAFELTNVAKANFYPTLTLNSATFGYSSTNTISNFFKPENLFANIIAGITQPIINKREIKTKYEVSKAEQQITLLNFERCVLNAGAEVSNTLNTYYTSISKIETRNIQIESLNKSVFYTQKLLRAGEATYLEVLSAQQGLLDARLSLTNDKLQQLQAYSDLYRTLGGGAD